MSIRIASVHLSRLACLTGLLAGLISLPSSALAQAGVNAPPTIAPLQVDPDPNGVNLVSGKMNVDLPILSVPAAPRLRFDRVQNALPKLQGTTHVGTPQSTPPVQMGYWSINIGGVTSEMFECIDYGSCQSKSPTGSAFSGQTFVKEGSGETWLFDQVSMVYECPGSGVRSETYYASQVQYPDGEVITYTYDTAQLHDSCGTRTFYRPTRMSSNTGYFITIAYEQGSTYTQAAWNRPLEVTIRRDDASQTLLGRLAYSYNDTTGVMTTHEYGSGSTARTYQTSGAANQLDYAVETWAATVKLPGESSNALTLGSSIYGLITSFNRDGVAWTYGYTNVQTAKDASGNNAEPHHKTYDAVSVSGPNGYSMSYLVGRGTNSPGLNVIKRQTDALGRQTNFAYDSFDRLFRITYPEGNRIDIAYGARNNITSRTAVPKAGSGLSNTTETITINSSACTQYWPGVLCWRPLAYTDGLGRQTNFEYNSRGQLTQQTDPADSNGVRRRTIIEYANSPSGISRKSVERICGWHPTNPALTTCGTTAEDRTEYEYWGNTSLPSLVRKVASGEARTTAFTYDAAGRQLAADGPLPGTADTKHARYDAYGRKTWEVGELAPNGKYMVRKFTYRDSDNKVTQVDAGTITSPASTSLTLINRTDTTYDSRRYPIRERTYNGSTNFQVTDRSFLNRGLPECTTVRMNLSSLPSATATGACSLGTQGSQGPDRITKNVYDNAGQLLKVQQGVGTPLLRDQVTYTYSNNGKKRFITDANGNKAEFRYDGHDRQSHWFFPHKTTVGAVSTTDYEQYGYDAAGNRTSLRRRDGRTLTFTYDGLNRMTSKVVPDGCAPIQVGACTPSSATRDVFYRYDMMGRQLTAKFDSATGADGITSAYNGFGNLTSSTISMGGFSRTLTGIYDEAGRRTRLTHPDSQAFTYAYDALNRLSGIYQGTGTTTPLNTFAYDNDGLLASRSEGSGASVVAYTWDKVGRLTSLADTFAGGTGNVSRTFVRNPASQVTQETRDNDAYAFDGLVAVNRNYAVNGLNQYTTAGPASFTYDANGNLTADGTNTYVYDAENRLVSATAAGQTTTLTYDPMGRLWRVVKGSADTRFLYDGDALVAEYNSAGTMTHRYVHGSNASADDPLVWYVGSGLTSKRWLHANHQGSIVAATSASTPGGSPTINSYDEYGIPGSGNVGRFQYTGQAWLPELGMYHYKARIYSPTLGRFLQTDPVGYKDQINLYAYVRNDPVNKIDSSGKTCEETDGKYKCKVDETNGLEKTMAGRRLLNQINTRYTNIVNRLMSNPERPRTIGAQNAAGKIEKTVSQREIGTALIGAKVIYSPEQARGTDGTLYRADARGELGSKENPFRITLYPWGVNKPGGQLERTFVHDGAHGTAPDAALREEWRRVPGADFELDHQDHYRRMSQEVIDD